MFLAPLPILCELCLYHLLWQGAGLGRTKVVAVSFLQSKYYWGRWAEVRGGGDYMLTSENEAGHCADREF